VFYFLVSQRNFRKLHVLLRGRKITLRNEKKLRKDFCMKKLYKLFGVIALAAVIGFVMAACGGGGGSSGPGTPPPTKFSVSGEFKGAGNSNAKFKATQTGTSSSSISRSARAAVSYELTGELEDGDMLFRLKGTYDSSTGKYTISSASSFARYTIIGNGNDATATLAVKQGDDWKTLLSA
jgi:hypothetical protein